MPLRGRSSALDEGSDTPYAHSDGVAIDESAGDGLPGARAWREEAHLRRTAESECAPKFRSTPAQHTSTRVGDERVRARRAEPMALVKKTANSSAHSFLKLNLLISLINF